MTSIQEGYSKIPQRNFKDNDENRFGRRNDAATKKKKSYHIKKKINHNRSSIFRATVSCIGITE